MNVFRTLMFAPANHPRRREKAFTLGADVVIQAKVSSAIQLDGQFVDYPIVRAAQRVLAMTRKHAGGHH